MALVLKEINYILCILKKALGKWDWCIFFLQTEKNVPAYRFYQKNEYTVCKADIEEDSIMPEK